MPAVEAKKWNPGSPGLRGARLGCACVCVCLPVERSRSLRCCLVEAAVAARSPPSPPGGPGPRRLCACGVKWARRWPRGSGMRAGGWGRQRRRGPASGLAAGGRWGAVVVPLVSEPGWPRSGLCWGAPGPQARGKASLTRSGERWGQRQPPPRERSRARPGGGSRGGAGGRRVLLRGAEFVTCLRVVRGWRRLRSRSSELGTFSTRVVSCS